MTFGVTTDIKICYLYMLLSAIFVESTEALLDDDTEGLAPNRPSKWMSLTLTTP